MILLGLGTNNSCSAIARIADCKAQLASLTSPPGKMSVKSVIRSFGFDFLMTAARVGSSSSPFSSNASITSWTI